jgi:DUF4097 and DUF4098 domain-containing protein YvlB
VVEVAPGGKDGGQLRVETGRIEDSQTLRVIYPGDRVIYPPSNRMSSSRVRVRADGTFYGKGRGSGRQVSIGGAGIGWSSGLEAFADLMIRVPAGQRIAVHLAMGRVEVSNVDGDLVVNVGSAPITAEGTRGNLRLDTGSGRIMVSDAEGLIELDTGSGSVEVNGIRGRQLLVDTGSGSVTGSGIDVEKLDVDTGSGAIRLAAARALEARLDTGSGGVDLELYNDDLRKLVIDTGSGSVRLALSPATNARFVIDTGSGGISVDLPVRVTRRERSRFEGELGDGAGSIRIDTGSGGVRIRSTDVVAVR